MTDTLQSRILSYGKDNYVCSDDVLAMRREVFKDGIVDQVELDAIFALSDYAPNGDRQWFDFFAEVTSDFFLREEEPQGYLTDNEFAKLKALVTRDHHIVNELELNLLVAVIRKATRVPAAMPEFIANQLRVYIRNKANGPVITKSDVALIRGFLYASGGEDNISISKSEAELLFDLNDLTAGASNDESFVELFSKAVAAHLMQYVGYTQPTREAALEAYARESDTAVRPARFLKEMFKSIPKIGKQFDRGGVSVLAADINDQLAGEAVANQVTSNEADWLADRIGANGELCDAERAVLSYMEEIGADLPPKLRAIANRAA